MIFRRKSGILKALNTAWSITASENKVRQMPADPKEWVKDSRSADE